MEGIRALSRRAPRPLIAPSAPPFTRPHQISHAPSPARLVRSAPHDDRGAVVIDIVPRSEHGTAGPSCVRLGAPAEFDLIAADPFANEAALPAWFPAAVRQIVCTQAG